MKQEIKFRIAPWRTMQVPRQEDVDKLLERTYESRVRENERERFIPELPEKPF